MHKVIDLLAALGLQKGRAVALLIVIAVLVPPLGTFLRPWIGETVFALLCVAFLRQDSSAMRQLFRRPAKVIIATFWTLVVVPLGFIGVLFMTGTTDPVHELLPILLFQAIASPMMAAPAMVALIGIDATLVLAVLTISTLLVPLTAPMLANLAGVELSISTGALALRLAGIVFGSMAIGWLFRRWIGSARVMQHTASIDGFNIILMGIFVCAVMGDLGLHLIRQPVQVVALTALAFAVFVAIFLFTFVVFRSAGREQAFALAVLSAQRNMGLMYAATGGVLAGQAWLYFSVAQFPLYLTPLLLTPLFHYLVSPNRGQVS